MIFRRLSRRHLVRWQSTKTVQPTKIRNIAEISTSSDRPRHSESGISITDESAKDSMVTLINQKLEKIENNPVDFKYYLRNYDQWDRNNLLPYKFGKNQQFSTNKNLPILNEILTRFEDDSSNLRITDAFGYGSKVFSQGDNIDISNSQIDMIMVVKDPIKFHDFNVRKNPTDYSFLKWFGSKTLNRVGNMGAGVYFNPFIDIDLHNKIKLELKYGVTTNEILLNDVINWNTLYLSGRLHKPVAIIRNDFKFLFSNQFNLTNAVKLALLLLNKKKITEFELYSTITGVSYMGDPRLKIKGENPNKVKNIVENQYTLFQRLYKPIIDNYLSEYVQRGKDDELLINLSRQTVAEILIELPRTFRSKLFANFKSEIGRDDIFVIDILKDPVFRPGQNLTNLTYSDLVNMKINETEPSEFEYLSVNNKVDSGFLNKISGSFIQDPNMFKKALTTTVESVVGESALIQSAKGILTAGAIRSYKYALAKRRKYNASKN